MTALEASHEPRMLVMHYPGLWRHDLKSLNPDKQKPRLAAGFCFIKEKL